ncbi:hypothetical protein ABTZ99_13335 [Actinosynnema sp. NPDC002837]
MTDNPGVEGSGSAWDSPDNGIDTHDQLLTEALALLRGLNLEERRVALHHVPVFLRLAGLGAQNGPGPVERTAGEGSAASSGIPGRARRPGY